MNLVARKQENRLRTSVIVPCSHGHAHLLSELFGYLQRQSRPPDEIIVSLSGCDAPVGPSSDVRILNSPMRLTAGQNRNRASEAATGDVLVYQDADDVPHPQRIEIISKLFEAYEIDHLMHYFVYKTGDMATFTHEEAVANSMYNTDPSHFGVHCGNVAIYRSIFQSVKWPEHPHIGEDQEFNRAVYKKFERTVVTKLALLTYRQNFSTFR